MDMREMTNKVKKGEPLYVRTSQQAAFKSIESIH